jgi:hypothetical protein
VPEKGTIFGEYIIPIIKNYVTGDFLIAYWYIPFIILMFTLSPLHVAFIRLGERRQMAIIAMLFVLSLFIHRPAFNLNPLHSLLYFMPVYLLGIWCAAHRSAIYDALRGKEAFLLLAVILLALLQTLLGRTGNYFKDLLIYDGVDLMLIQKTIMSLFFMVWLHRFEHANHVVLSTLANTSFSIFFLHGYVIWLVERFSFVVAMPDLTYVLLSMLVVAICAVIALVSKRLLHGYSRYVTGY